MSVIRYERGADGVVRESVSNDGGKTYTSTGANSSNGYSGSAYSGGSSGNKSSGNSGGTNYSGYNQNQYNNQSAYLQNLINTGTTGQQAWAQTELNKLNSQYGGGTSQGSGSSGSSGGNSAVSSPSQPAQQWDTSGWNNYTGATGKQFSVAPSNGTIIVTTNGVQRRVLPTDADYNSTYQSMLKDLQSNGVNYTPIQTYGKDSDLDGVTEYYNTKAYTWGNADLQYALQQAAQTTPGISVEDYVKSLYARIGQNNAAGTGIVTLADVNAELDRLGLSDYNSQNAIYTAGGTLLPGNELLRYHDDNGQSSNSPDSRWVAYGGQDYLLGGDSANLAAYANAKTGNVDNLALIFGNMANNPYAMQDPEFLMQYNQQLNAFNNAAGIQSSAPAGSLTGNQNVDNVINYWNSMNNYGNVSGGSGNVGTSSLLELLQSYLDGGLEANKGFLEQQRALAQQNAEKAASDAYVNQMLQQDAAKQQLSALGLGTSGALQSAQMGIQGNYGNNLSEINNNLNTMLSSLSEQELQILTDYYNNMANYAYDVTQYEQDYALQQAQLALQQQQAAYNQQMAERELALQQAKWEWEMQNYANEQQQYQNETAYNQKLQQAAQYESLYNAGLMNGQGLKDALASLGLISGNYFNSAGSVTGNATGGSGSSGSTSTKQSGGKTATTQQSVGNSGNDAVSLAKLLATGQSSINPLRQLANGIVSGL